MKNQKIADHYPTQGGVSYLSVFAVVFFIIGLFLLLKGVLKPDESLILPSIGFFLAAIFFVLGAVLLKMQPNRGMPSDN